MDRVRFCSGLEAIHDCGDNGVIPSSVYTCHNDGSIAHFNGAIWFCDVREIRRDCCATKHSSL